MDISQKSWHYRLLKYFSNKAEDIPQNLCGYFWGIVTILLLVSFVGLCAGSLLCGVATPLLTNLHGHGTSFEQWNDAGKSTLILLGIIALFLFSVRFMSKLLEKFFRLIYGFYGLMYGLVVGLAVIGIPGLVINLINHGLDTNHYSWLGSRESLLGFIGGFGILLDVAMIIVVLAGLTIAGIIYFCKFLHRYEFVQLFLAFLKAKKDKYCLKLNFIP